MSDLRKGPSWPIALLLLAIAAFFYADRSARTQFAQNNYAGTSSGSANAQVITIPNVGALTDILYQPITFTAGFTNTGATTLTANSLGVQAVGRAVPGQGMVSLGGAEIVATQTVTVMWDGTRFQLLTNATPDPPGKVMDYAAASCPTGYFQANSQTLSQAAFPALFSVLGSTWGSSGGGLFTTPDLRNRTTYGLDSNVGGFSSRITVAGGNFNGQTIGAAGAAQNIALGVNQIPVITPAGAVSVTPTGSVSVGTPAGTITINDPGHAHLPNPGSATVGTSLASFNSSVGVVVVPTGSTPLIGTQATTTGITASFSGNALSASFTGSPSSGTFTGSAFNPGGGQAHPTLSPGAIVSKCVRA